MDFNKLSVIIKKFKSFHLSKVCNLQHKSKINVNITKNVTPLVVGAIRRLQVISKTKVTFNHNDSLLPDWSHLA